MLAQFINRLKSINIWHFVWISLVLSECLTATMSLLLKGGLALDYLVTGAVVSLMVSSSVIYLILVERKRREDAIRESEEKYRALMRDAGDAIFLTDTEGNLLGVNKKAEELTGYTDEELLRMHFSELHRRDYIGEVAATFREGIKKGSGSYGEMELLRKDGSIAFVDLAGSSVEYAGKKLGQAIARDVTERKRMEKEINERDEFIQGILSSIHSHIAVINRDGFIIAVNEAWNEFACENGTVDSDKVGVGVNYLEACLAEGGEFYELSREAHKGIKSVLECAAPVFKLEYPCHSETERRWFQMYVTPLKSKCEGAVVTHIDITERRKAEEELQRYTLRLEEYTSEIMQAEEELREKTRQLEKMGMELEERVREEADIRRKREQLLEQQSKLAAMGEMIGAISHQWRQPLTVLALTFQGIEQRYRSGMMDEEYIRDVKDMSMNQILYMSKTMDDFMNFFMPAKEKRHFDVRRTVEEVLSMLSAQLSHSHIDVEMDARAEGPIMVAGYPNEIKQILINIVNNSKDAILERRRVGLMGRGEGKVWIEVQSTGGRAKVSVGDNGGGIPEEIIEHVFEPYFTTKEEGKGTGLGLYISKLIIEHDMGGSLSALNVEGGAVFTLELKKGREGTENFIEPAFEKI
jgi:PAS domain S-box-containing protein